MLHLAHARACGVTPNLHSRSRLLVSYDCMRPAAHSLTVGGRLVVSDLQQTAGMHVIISTSGHEVKNTRSFVEVIERSSTPPCESEGPYPARVVLSYVACQSYLGICGLRPSNLHGGISGFFTESV